MSCPLCRERKGKRQCPAKDERICSQCCGSKRLVEIDCPPDCVFLSGAHAPAWEGRETERARDRRRISPFVQGLKDAQLQLVLVGLVGINGLRSQRRELQDRLVLDALGALRKTLETRGRGILYEHAADDLRAQGLLHDLQGLFESRDAEGRAVSPADADLLPALLALESIASECLRGGGTSEFLELATRLAGELQRDAQPRQPRLIVTP